MGRKKLTAAQKAANKVERERKKINARNLKAVGGAGSLFAGLVETVTFGQAAWNMRRTKAVAVEQMHASPCSPLAFGMDLFQVNVIESFARTAFAAGEFEELRAYCHHTYPSPVYWRSFWKGVLTGAKRAVLSVRREPAANTFGFRVVPDRELPAAGFVPPLTATGFDARFPVVEAKQTAEAEAETSDAVFASVMTKIQRPEVPAMLEPTTFTGRVLACQLVEVVKGVGGFGQKFNPNPQRKYAAKVFGVPLYRKGGKAVRSFETRAAAEKAGVTAAKEAVARLRDELAAVGVAAVVKCEAGGLVEVMLASSNPADVMDRLSPVAQAAAERLNANVKVLPA